MNIFCLAETTVSKLVTIEQMVKKILSGQLMRWRPAVWPLKGVIYFMDAAFVQKLNHRILGDNT